MFAGFSAESLAQRIMDCRPKVVITCNAVMRGSKIIYLKEIVDRALMESAHNGINTGEKILKDKCTKISLFYFWLSRFPNFQEII